MERPPLEDLGSARGLASWADRRRIERDRDLIEELTGTRSAAGSSAAATAGGSSVAFEADPNYYPID